MPQSVRRCLPQFGQQRTAPLQRAGNSRPSAPPPQQTLTPLQTVQTFTVRSPERLHREGGRHHLPLLSKANAAA